jgi:hypothetical protein
MSSFSTAGGGVKAPTYLVPGIRGKQPGGDIAYVKASLGGIRVDSLGGTLNTVLDITGPGIWTVGYFMSGGTSTSARVIITIDGIVVLDDTDTNLYTVGMSQVGTLYATSTSYSSTGPIGHVPFNKTLKIQCQCNVTGLYIYNYYLT